MRTTLITITLILAGGLAFADNVPYRELTAEEKAGLEAIAPTKAPAKPRKKRKVLISHLTMKNGKPYGGHPSAPFADYVITYMGRMSGAFDTVISDNKEAFRRENLKQFDAIIFNNTVGVLFDDADLRESLLDFVREGKGFAGFHAAGATFVEYPRYDFFPEFGVMLGGYEDGGHPWRHTETIPVKIDDPDSPLNAVFKGQPFEIQDEAFQFREPTLRDRLHVLLSIDMSRVKPNPRRRILKQRQADLDFPVAWIKTYGKGRVYYTFTGHHPPSFQRRDMLEHYLAAIQFILGDLEADTTPSAFLKR